MKEKAVLKQITEGMGERQRTKGGKQWGTDRINKGWGRREGRGGGENDEINCGVLGSEQHEDI